MANRSLILCELFSKEGEKNLHVQEKKNWWLLVVCSFSRGLAVGGHDYTIGLSARSIGQNLHMNSQQ